MKKSYDALREKLDSVKNSLILTEITPEEALDILVIDENYSAIKARSLVNSWVEKNPSCGFDLIN